MGDFKCEEVRPTVSLHWDDVLTVVLFYIVVLAVGVWATVRARKRSDPRGYFLAGKSMTFFPVGASIFGSSIGAPYFVGLAGTAAASGIAGIIFEWLAIPFILMLSWVFVPVITACGVYTMPEYIRRRYGRERLRTYLSFLSILLYVITKISVEMYAGAVFVQILFGWNMYLSGVMVLSFSALFTMTGGLTAVIFTNTLQTIVLAIGAFVLMGISLDKVGGYDSLKEKYMQAVPTINTNLTLANSTCGQPRADAFSLMRDPLTSDYPWVGTFIFNIPGHIWCWCSDQADLPISTITIVVQRALSAKSLSHAKGGSIVAGYLKILPFFMFIVPGLAARILYPDEVACVDPAVCQCICDNPNGCSNIAYALLVLRVLHPGLRGLMLAALFAAVMSSLTSVFNSASSIFTMDLWRRFRSHATQLELLVVGRLVVLVLVGLSVIWIPIMSAAQGDELWQYWQMLQSAVGPPWAMVFIFGIFWKRTTEPAAFYGILGGQAVGISRLILTFIYPAPRCGEPDMRHAFLKIHFLYVAAMQIAVSGVLMVVISLLTSPRPPRKLRRVTLWTRNDPRMPDSSDTEEGEANDPLNDVKDPFNDVKDPLNDAKNPLNDAKDPDHDTASDSPDSQKTHPDANHKSAMPKWEHRLLVCCGMAEHNDQHEMTSEEVAALQRKMTSISEPPLVKRILDLNALILLAVVAVLVGLYH